MVVVCQDSGTRNNELFAHHLCLKLQNAGHAAVFAGGCVRDKQLGVQPKDYDVATSAKPEQVIALFKDEFRVVEVGINFGVVRIIKQESVGMSQTVVNMYEVEVATFRQESNYTDGRRPDKVEFVSMIEQDLARRDLTINAMAYDPVSGTLIDPYGGQSDLRSKIIHAVGNPSERFAEDYLRMMRAVRFTARFNGYLSKESMLAIQANAHHIVKISAERVSDELTKILLGPNAGLGLTLLMETGLMYYILPEFTEKYGNLEISEYMRHSPMRTCHRIFGSIHQLQHSGHLDGESAYAILLLRLDVPIDRLLMRLRATMHINTGEVCQIIHDMPSVYELDQCSLAKQYELCSRDYFWKCVDISRAQGSKVNYNQIFIYHAYQAPLKLGAKPIIDGKFLIDRGAITGKLMGVMLEDAKIAQINGKFQDVEGATKWVQEFILPKV